MISDARRRLAVAAVAVTTLVLQATAVPAATFTIVSADGPGEGFNDPTSATPVGGNSGTTIGAQRLIAFQYAANLWGARIPSATAIRVSASFDELYCTLSSAVLGQAGPSALNRDFVNAPLANTWYVPSLANIIAGTDINPALTEIDAQFNSNLGKVNCLTGTFFYYGLDGNEGSDIDFVTVLTHELGHGLGFLSLVDPSTGQRLGGRDDIFSYFLEDHSTGKVFPDMIDYQRAVASTDGSQTSSDLHWVGLEAAEIGQALTGGLHASDHLLMYAPNPVQPGSSISHWAKVLTPNKLMEPSFTAALHSVDLELGLLADLGYPSIYPCGDATQDDAITATDALVALRASVGSGTCVETLCDVNGTGNTTATDALIILNAAIGLSIEMTCGLT